MPNNYLRPIHIRYRIPDSIGLRLLVEGETTNNPPEGCGMLYLKMFEYGFGLLLHPLPQAFLSTIDLAPTHIAPNVWDVVFGLVVLWWLRCRETEDIEQLNAKQLLICFKVKRILRKPGRFYLCAGKGAGSIIKGQTSIKRWKGK